MSNSAVTASVTFIDLATFGELEGFMYGGPNAITWFVASVQKGNWFSVVPISLRNVGTTAQFAAQKTSYSLSRQGDYVLSTWLRCRWPTIGLNAAQNGTGATVRFVDNLMHNLVRHIQIEFNELVVQEFDNYWFDDNLVWRTDASKYLGYLNMIGMTSVYTQPAVQGTTVGGTFLNLPHPLFYQEDSGVALPVAALPFNDIKITYDFRDWTELVLVDPKATFGTGNQATIQSVVPYINGVPQPNLQVQLQNVETYAHYAVVHNDERVKMGDAPRDILIHQIQETQIAPFRDITARSSFDIRLSHAIVLFTYKAMNNSLQVFFNGLFGADHSNYTTQSSVLADGLVPPPPGQLPVDPIAYTQLLYENSVRLSNASDYFSLVNPWYFSLSMGQDINATGFHFYSYALKPWDPTRPSGSTDYSKLANVSIVHDPSQAAVSAAAGQYPNGVNIQWPVAQAVFPQSFQHVFCAKNWNILRVANGSAGFPAL